MHPKDDNKYGNALSVVFYFRHGSHAILFPGDMTPEGMAHILANGKGVQKRFSRFEKGFAQKHPGWHEETGSQPTLKELLGRGLTVLVLRTTGWNRAIRRSYSRRCGVASLA